MFFSFQNGITKVCESVESEKNSIYETGQNFKLIKFGLIFFFVLIVLFYFILNKSEIIDIALKNNNNKIIKLDIDNRIKEYQYENDVDYSSFSTKIKSIAIYYPNIYLDYFLKIISSSRQKNTLRDLIQD